jgi:hypothetical protein
MSQQQMMMNRQGMHPPPIHTSMYTSMPPQYNQQITPQYNQAPRR